MVRTQVRLYTYPYMRMRTTPTGPVTLCMRRKRKKKESIATFMLLRAPETSHISFIYVEAAKKGVHARCQES